MKRAALENLLHEALAALNDAPCDCRCSIHNDTVIRTKWDSQHHAVLKTEHCRRVLCRRCAVFVKAADVLKPSAASPSTASA